MRERVTLVLALAGILSVGVFLAYLAFFKPGEAAALPLPGPTDCDYGPITDFVTDTDERPAPIADWAYCVDRECFSALRFLGECNGKKVSLRGKVDVDYDCSFCPSNDPCADCVEFVAVHGIELTPIDIGEIKRDYQDQLATVRGTLRWTGSVTRPSLDVTSIDK